MILVYGGVQVDTVQTSPPRFPEDAVVDVAERVRGLLHRMHPRMVLGAAASGADLVVAHAARLEGIPVRLVLPHDRATFRRTSVESRGAPWTDRYHRLLLDLDPAAVEEHDDSPQAERVYQRHNRRMLDRAAALAGPDEQVWCLVVRPSGARHPSVSDDLAAAAEDRGVLVLDIDPTVTTRRTAFVAMPFGKKTDPESRQSVDCDVVFDRVYAPVLEDLDLEWHRADLETDSGIIHVGMIEALATSDLVIADLFTGNANVAYELGLRHALARRSTVVAFPRLVDVGVRQDVPFDLKLNRYVGFARGSDGISDEQAAAAIRELRRVLREVLAGSDTDSPVLEFFDRDDAGHLTRRSELEHAIAEESAAREAVQDAIDSSSADRMREASADLDRSHLSPRARQGLRLQLAIGLSDQGAFDYAAALFERAEPDPTDRLRRIWLQQHGLLLSRAGRVRDEAGADPTEHWHTAQLLLDEARRRYGDSEETCGIAAGIAKRQLDHALRTGAVDRAQAALDRMISLYRVGFQAEPDYYGGLNLIASLRLDLQHFSCDPGRLSEIRTILPVTVFFADRAAASSPEAFWPAVSVAELALHAALIAAQPEVTEAAQPDVAQAARLYARASALPAAPEWRRAAAAQLRLFARCGDDPGTIDRMLAAMEQQPSGRAGHTNPSDQDIGLWRSHSSTR